MKLYVLSDIHAEFTAFTPDPKALQAADVVVLAGDIHDGEFVPTWARETFGDVPIIWVAGNHEFYNHHWERCLADMRRAAKQRSMHFLENETVTIDGVDFLGATLWTDFEMMGSKSESITEASRYMVDYRKISGCSPFKTIERHNHVVAFVGVGDRGGQQFLGAVRGSNHFYAFSGTASATLILDILPALKSGDSCCQTAMSRRENVFSCVRVPVVYRAAVAANPFSYSQTCSTFRTAGGNAPAARTSLGGVVFVDYLEDDTGLMALVFQHRL